MCHHVITRYLILVDSIPTIAALIISVIFVPVNAVLIFQVFKCALLNNSVKVRFQIQFWLCQIQLIVQFQQQRRILGKFYSLAVC